MDKSFSRLLGSLSRCLGNDLKDYNVGEDRTYTLIITPPIQKDTVKHIRVICKAMMPGASVRFAPKRGRVTVKRNY